ncbi:MAG TPA: NAD(P)H-dependent glycerol-3-phosphate dehydrogenase, partial [Paracoccaceae bacterium]|nr:NAD(P)H-dependent glycerol-3-phosphate dehydrogenase [Paracoccaceae bacterium]
MKIAVAGAGAFGTALAIALKAGGRDVALWGRQSAAMDALLETRVSPHLPGVTLPDNLAVSANIDTVLQADVILLAVPAQALDGFLGHYGKALAGKRLIACCKGIDVYSLQSPSMTIAAHVPDATIAALTGPSFAADIARGLPTALTLACEDPEKGQDLQELLSTQSLRLYRTTDILGAEFGGALKNVIAIACGACIGAGLGDSARAALLTRGFGEMVRFATHLGAKPETLSGLSGLGDLALTCTSDQSRNYRYGQSIGRGVAFDPAVTVEGIAT